MLLVLLSVKTRFLTRCNLFFKDFTLIEKNRKSKEHKEDGVGKKQFGFLSQILKIMPSVTVMMKSATNMLCFSKNTGLKLELLHLHYTQHIFRHMVAFGSFLMQNSQPWHQHNKQCVESNLCPPAGAGQDRIRHSCKGVTMGAGLLVPK